MVLLSGSLTIVHTGLMSQRLELHGELRLDGYKQVHIREEFENSPSLLGLVSHLKTGSSNSHSACVGQLTRHLLAYWLQGPRYLSLQCSPRPYNIPMNAPPRLCCRELLWTLHHVMPRLAAGLLATVQSIGRQRIYPTNAIPAPRMYFSVPGANASLQVNDRHSSRRPE